MAIGPNDSSFVENLIIDLENSFDNMIRSSYIRKNTPMTFVVGYNIPEEEELINAIKERIENSYLDAGWSAVTFYYSNGNCSLTLESAEEPNDESSNPEMT